MQIWTLNFFVQLTDNKDNFHDIMFVMTSATQEHKTMKTWKIYQTKNNQVIQLHCRPDGGANVILLCANQRYFKTFI